MKRVAILLALTALMAFAPAAFACVKCNTTVGCYGTEIGVPGFTDCYFDGTCHNIRPLCQGFVEEPQLAASYSVAAVHVVETETTKSATVEATPAPAPAKAVAAER